MTQASTLGKLYWVCIAQPWQWEATGFCEKLMEASFISGRANP